jgi:hypothetical protein
MKLQPEPPAAAKVAQIMVEVVGPDGLVHHVGPFQTHAAAQAWIARHTPDNSSAPDRVRKKFATDNRRDPAASE